MSDLQAWVAPTCERLADVLADSPLEAWDRPSLCEGWQVRHVVAHVTMPARLTPAQFGAEMAAAGGDFGVLSDAVAARDATLPVAEHLAGLRSPVLHQWQPPGGGAVGALTHAVVHAVDALAPLGHQAVLPAEAVREVLDQLVAADGHWFGVDLRDVRLESADGSWGQADGEVVRADTASLVALVSGRTLPDGRSLRRRG